MMKGFKVTDRNRRKLVGVACDSLEMLVVKGREKLAIAEDVTATLDDGTIVDDEDYFQALPPQTVVVLHRKSEEILTGVDFILNALRRVNASYLRTGSNANEFLLEKTRELASLLRGAEEEREEKILRNTPQEDPDWFADLETNARTKDEYMFRKSQDRIRGYLYKFQEDLRRSELYLRDARARGIVGECLEFLKRRLKEDDYFGCYFDRRCALGSRDALDSGPRSKRKRIRTEKKSKRDVRGEEAGEVGYDKFSYCDDSGKFVCQGKWKAEKCHSGDHQINPYLSKEARILFSTWNLDHRIERSRSVAPTLVKAIQACGKSQSVNFLYFYQLLFTKLNLKLVHVVCHDKSAHDVSCDPRFLYT